MLTEQTHCDIWHPYQPIPRLRSRSSSSPRARALVLSPPHKINDRLPITHLLRSCRVPRIPSRTTSTEELRFPEACRGETAYPDRVYAFPGLYFGFLCSLTSVLTYDTIRWSSLLSNLLSKFSWTPSPGNLNGRQMHSPANFNPNSILPSMRTWGIGLERHLLHCMLRIWAPSGLTGCECHSFALKAESVIDLFCLRYSAYHHSHPTLTERLKGLEAFQAKRALSEKKVT